MPTLTAPHRVAPEEMVFHMSLLSLMVPVATQHQPRPRPRSAMPTLTATHMVALEEAELGSATVATQHRPQPRSAAIPRPPKVTLLLDLGFPFPSGPMLPVRPTQLRVQRQLGGATPPHKPWSLAAPAQAQPWRRARRMQSLGKACRLPLSRLSAGMRPPKRCRTSMGADLAYQVSVQALASPM